MTGRAEASTLEQLAPDLWVATRPLKLIVGDIGTRMTVIRLRDGGLFLHSPVHLDEKTREALDALGPVRAVVAPNLHHHLFIRDYADAYPRARFYAAPGLRAKRPQTRFDDELGDEAPPEWRGEIEQLIFQGAAPISEVVFLHKATRTLLLTDLAFNVPAGRTGSAGIFYWLVGAKGRFGPHRVVRMGIRDRRAARTSLDAMLRWDFSRITVTHGEVLATNGKEHLAAGFSFLPR
jgi:hypothetical protein